MTGSNAPRIAPTDGLSHVIGASEPPLIDRTIPDFLGAAVARDPEREAAVFCQAGERWSYDGLQRRVDRLAAGLLALGLYKGDRIGIWSPNKPEWLLAQFATARIGLILVNVNPAYRRHELEYVLNKVEAKALITARRFKSSDYIVMLRDLAPELDTATPGRLRAKRLPHLATVIQIGSEPIAGMFSFDEVMGKGGGGNRARLDAISKGLDADDAINIQFTSGTTGAPKGATLTHRNIVNNGRYCAYAMDLGTRGPPCHPGALLSLLRHGAGQSRRGGGRLHHGVSRRGLRCARLSESPVGRALQRRARRAHHVRRHDRP